jgi:hypothetical protein
MMQAGEAAFLKEDWATQGDWVGRYGHKYTILCAMGSPFSHEFHLDRTYRVRPGIGSNHKNDALRAWCWSRTSNERRVSYDPTIGGRRPAGWDDHAEAYPWTHEGPDLRLEVKVPAGVHRLALYFLNYDGQEKNNRFRDYLVEVRKPETDGEALAVSRVRDFHQGVYKQFLLAGPAAFQLNIRKNNSFNTMLSGVMFDQVAGPRSVWEGWPMFWIGNIPYRPPPFPDSVLVEKPENAGVRLWRALEDSGGLDGVWKFNSLMQTLAHRHAAQAGLPAEALLSMRMKGDFWTPEDQNIFIETMKNRWQAQLKLTPDIAE